MDVVFMQVMGLYLDCEYFMKLAVMTVFFQVPKALHQKHHNYCAQIPDSFETQSDEQATRQQYPLSEQLCSENAKIVLNYAAFLATLPAWYAHNNFRNIAYFLNLPDADEFGNRQVNEAIESNFFDFII